MAELTIKAVLAGLIFGVLFGAANAYLGLTSGLTVSTSIPIAVLAAATFKLAPRGGTILEANLAQTIGSASSSLASGTIFTIPALFMWGLAPSTTQVALLAFAGGVLGILAMVPLRRLLIVQADAELPYPEGRACAEVLQATQKSSSASKWIFIGIALGIAAKALVSFWHVVPEDASIALGGNAGLAIRIAPALLAVGFIVGFRAATVMVSGALISALVLYPLVTKSHFAGLVDAQLADAAMLASGTVRSRFVIFLGAGAVAAAGLVTIARTAPTMVRSFRAVVSGLKSGASGGSGERTDRDVPAWLLVVGLVGIFALLALTPGIFAGDLSLEMRVVAALGVVVFGFLFVPVSSRLVGVIGVSSNPTSAMALITIAGVAAVFLAIGMEGLGAKAAVLTVGTVVCVAASKAGDISQDLKTGWLVKGTPYIQQYGQLLAASIACWAVAGVVVALGHGKDPYGSPSLAAPQATLMKTVAEAVLGGSLPWDLVAMGAALAGVGALLGLPALPFALGIYLPLATMAAVFAGGVVRKVVEARAKEKVDLEAGVLCASGFVAGEGLAGVLVAAHSLATGAGKPAAHAWTGFEMLLGLALLVISGAVLWRATRKSAG